ncbi:hypothetical protein KXD96_28145 (plasmid) [Mycobacterium sp. SMC-2]|uniref:hypothetical protein n=1 Tax=Mycobacterium sp. SMC-2 TaxID=2857058 RepID=UPI0021B2DAB7|nr:hypothetical protein [Mycobacterium sp. SMC-2]UXA06606.1 hypothetical protein KXD96_00035 [Mycobacterium sp. SMC-2]UXA09634.1 hypothetical protein KXD96_28145 [Mycobacterium sp. SMC-2]
MPNIDPTQLKQTVETAITELDALVALAEEIPGEPAKVKTVLETIDKALKDTQAFLSA